MCLCTHTFRLPWQINWHHADLWANSPFVLSRLSTEDLCSCFYSFFCIINYPSATSFPSAYKHYILYLILKALNPTFPFSFIAKLLKSMYLNTLSPCCRITFSLQPISIGNVSSPLYWRLLVSSPSVFLQLRDQFCFHLTAPFNSTWQVVILSFNTLFTLLPDHQLLLSSYLGGPSASFKSVSLLPDLAGAQSCIQILNFSFAFLF